MNTNAKAGPSAISVLDASRETGVPAGAIGQLIKQRRIFFLPVEGELYISKAILPDLARMAKKYVKPRPVEAGDHETGGLG